MTNIQTSMEQFERPDPVLTNKIVTHLKSQGIFDQFRRECMADVDTKPAYHNLRQRVEGSVAAFLRMNPWRPDMNKNQLRDNLRKHIQSGGFLDIGVDRIVDQVVNPKIYTVFLPKVEEVVQNCMGRENDQPKFDPPPPTEVKTELPKFQDKHNLAPRAKLPAPLMGPMLKPLKPPDQEESRSSPVTAKLMDNGGDTDTEEAADKKYVVDDDDLEDKEDEDDEESPPFEPHSEGDRLILGMRSESSENSNDSQLVTTIVDDSLEERIDNNETTVKEESDKKDEDSSSDEYVPKTPTINMDESDGTVLEFNSISEYKQYQTKFEEESVGNIEEVVSSQCINDNREAMKDEISSTEEDYLRGSHKKKFNIDSYDDASSSSIDKESTSDEIKPAVFESFVKKRFKLEDYDHENETSELSMNEAENDDSYTERSLDMTDSKMKVYENEHHEKHKSSSPSSKDSGRSYHLYHSHLKDLRESSNHLSSKDKTSEKHYQEEPRSSHSSKDKKDRHKKSEKHESSKDRHKERDRKRSESSSKHGEKDGKSKHYDKEKEKVKDKKRSNSSERKKGKEDADKNRKESRHEHKDHQESKSRDHHDKEKKKHNSRDRYADEKKDHETVHKSDKDRRDDSKHSSSRHSHRSSSEKYKSDKDHKHKGSSGRHKSHDDKSEKGKEESRKKYRHHCKYPSDKDENRRSSDRDSSGPSSRNHVSSSSKSTSSRTQRETKVDTGERTTSNSDNIVSDNIEALQRDSKFDSINEHGIDSPDSLSVVDSWNISDFIGSDWNSSKEEQQQTFKSENTPTDISSNVQDDKMKLSENLEGDKTILDSGIPHSQDVVYVYQVDPETDDCMDSLDKNSTCVNNEKQDFAIPSVSIHDSSSEKENIEQVLKEQTTIEPEDNTDASLDEDSTVIKFKKPKIAKNIHEVKKIMEARRHLKRMEKKRMRLLMKSNTEEYESDEKSPNDDRLEDGLQNDIFRGFEGVISSEKIKTYDCLIERLKNEASQLEKLVNYEQINSNLVTSWIDINPDLDTYIENTLKGMVHRKYRVRLPPICDEYYKYDSEQNLYFLMKNLDDIEQKEVLVDSNLNNLNSIHPTDQQENNTFYNEVNNCKRRKLNEVELPCVNSEIVHEGNDYSEQCSPKRKTSSNQSHPDDKDGEILEENISNAKIKRVTKNVGNKTDTSSDVIASPKFNFSITFNQTYDEVLKEKAQNSVVPPKKEMEEIHKTSRTVVKITNNKTSEQVFMKQIQSNPEDKVQVPRITRSETVLNGKISETPPELQQIPLISRITRTKNASTIKAKSRFTNGIISPESIIHFEEELPRRVSQKIINDVIGIQDPFDQGDNSDQSSHSGEDSPDERRRRMTGCKQQQRYDSSDLYKPRLQLSSRRVKTAGSSPEETSPVAEMVSKRKRSAAADLNPVTSKRRR